MCRKIQNYANYVVNIKKKPYICKLKSSISTGTTLPRVGFRWFAYIKT